MAALLGRLRREMNGAVAEAMARGGISGLLNYGVSIPTIRSIVAEESFDHDFARYLYRQQVRELRIAALLLADPAQLTAEEAEGWLEGAVSWELRDLLACHLLSLSHEAELSERLLIWLKQGDESACYTAIHTLARNGNPLTEEFQQGVVGALDRFAESEMVANMVVRLFSFRFAEFPACRFPDTRAGRYVEEELKALYGVE